MSLSTNLRNARASKKLTQKQVADMAGVSLVYYKELESGKKTPRVPLADIARVLGVGLESLLT